MNFKETVSNIIRGNVPGVEITTPEWERVEKDIITVARSFGLEILLWDTVRGLHKGEERISPSNNINELVAAIENAQNTAIIFKNFNPNFKSPAVQQAIRDCLYAAKTAGNILFFVSASGEIPAELEKEILKIEYQYPSSQEYGELLLALKEDATPEEVARVGEALKGTTLNEAENIIALALITTDMQVTDETVKLIKKQKAMMLKKLGTLELYEPEDLPEVGGLQIIKRWLSERKLAFSREARDFGLPFPKGILVFGIPGTGKSLIAKTIAKEWDIPLLVMGNILDKYVGESERKMKETLKQAEAMAPCVLMIDEVEKFFAGVGGNTDSGVSSRVFGQFLTWMQETTAPAFVVATANNITKLPPEFLRKGRFDENFFVDLPSTEERREILAIHIRRKKRNPENFDLDLLAEESAGFTGSEIEQVVISALFRAFSAGKDIDTPTLLEIIKETVPLSVTMQETIEAMRAWGRIHAKPASVNEDEEKPEKKAEQKRKRKIRF